MASKPTKSSVNSSQKTTQPATSLKAPQKFSWLRLLPILVFVVAAGAFIVWRSYAGTIDPAVVSAYQSALGRSPDQSGGEFWTGQISAGKITASALAARLGDTSEGVCYRKKLAGTIAADAAGCVVVASSPSSSSSSTKSSTSTSTISDADARSIVIYTFQAVLKRAPRDGELTSYATAIKNRTMTAAQLKERLEASSEGQAKLAAAAPKSTAATSKVGGKVLSTKCEARASSATVDAEYKKYLGRAATPAVSAYWVKLLNGCSKTVGDLDNYLKSSNEGRKFATTKVSPSNCDGRGLPAGTKFYATKLDGSKIEIALKDVDSNEAADGNTSHDTYYVTPDGKQGDYLDHITSIRYYTRVDAGIFGDTPAVKGWIKDFISCRKTIDQIREEIKNSPEGQARDGAFEKGVAAIAEAYAAAGKDFDESCIGKGHGYNSSKFAIESFNKCAWYPGEETAIAIGEGSISAEEVNPCTGWVRSSGESAFAAVFDSIGDEGGLDCSSTIEAFNSQTNPQRAAAELPTEVKQAVEEALQSEQDSVNASSDINTPDNSDSDASEAGCGSITVDPASSCLGSSQASAYGSSSEASDAAAAASYSLILSGQPATKLATADVARQILLASVNTTTTSAQSCKSGSTYPDTKLGDSGRCVVLVRWYAAGITNTKASPSIMFDSKLQSSVARLQVAANLSRQDGVVDQATWDYFKKSAQAVRDRASVQAQQLREQADRSWLLKQSQVQVALPACSDRPTLAIGATGDCVKRAALLLNAALGSKLKADGVYTATTQKGVRTYQAAHGLQNTGTMTVETWRYLETSNVKPTYYSPYQPTSGTFVVSR